MVRLGKVVVHPSAAFGALTIFVPVNNMIDKNGNFVSPVTMEKKTGAGSLPGSIVSIGCIAPPSITGSCDITISGFTRPAIGP